MNYVEAFIRNHRSAERDGLEAHEKTIYTQTCSLCNVLQPEAPEAFLLVH